MSDPIETAEQAHRDIDAPPMSESPWFAGAVLLVTVVLGVLLTHQLYF